MLKIVNSEYVKANASSASIRILDNGEAVAKHVYILRECCKLMSILALLRQQTSLRLYSNIY